MRLLIIVILSPLQNKTFPYSKSPNILPVIMFVILRAVGGVASIVALDPVGHHGHPKNSYQTNLPLHCGWCDAIEFLR
jgi:hypothetical protein